jgi:hypothetical protein
MFAGKARRGITLGILLWLALALLANIWAWLERPARDKKSILFCPCISYDTFYNICPSILTKKYIVVGVTYAEVFIKLSAF